MNRKKIFNKRFSLTWCADEDEKELLVNSVFPKKINSKMKSIESKLLNWIETHTNH